MVGTAKISQIYQCNNDEDPIRFHAMAQLFLEAVNMSEIGGKTLQFGARHHFIKKCC